MTHKKLFSSGVLVLFLLLLLLVVAHAQEPVTPLFPLHNSTTTNDQPLIAWTSSELPNVSYRFELSLNNDFESPATHTAIITNPYYQVPVQQEPGTWYWRVRVINSTGNITTTSPVYSYTVIAPPEFSIVPDTTKYHNNQRVDFHINAPLGSALKLFITKHSFTLPFTTSNLQTNTFTAFLEPGIYQLNATYNYSEFSSLYHSSFVLTEPVINEIRLTFNVTTKNNTPIKDVTIKLQGTQDTYTGATNNQGLWSQLVPVGRYDILLTHPDYEYESFRRTLQEDASFNLELQPQELLTVQEETPQLLSTNQWVPTITINSPDYRATVEGTSFQLVFTIDEPQGIASCDVLSQSQNAQGWQVITSTSNLSTTNTLVITDLASGEQSLKIRCEKASQTAQSPPRTIIVRNKPQSYEPLAAFIRDLQTTNYQSTTTPLFQSLNAAGNLSKAKKHLSDLEEEYKQADEEEQAIIAQTIDQHITEYASSLIRSFKVLSEQETVITPSADHYQGPNQRAVKQAQQDYVFRQKTLLASTTLFDQTTSYHTAIIINPQSMTGSTEQLTIEYSFPAVYLQRIGTPNIIDQEGNPTGTYQDDQFIITTTPNKPFVLLFTGDVTSSLPDQTLLTVIPLPSNVSSEQEYSGSGLSALTGRVIETVEGTGINTTLLTIILVCALIAVIIFKNPVYTITDYRADNRVKTVTNDIHSVMDLFQQRAHQQAFNLYPKVFDLYEKLPAVHQQELSFAMNHLSLELETYPLRQELARARRALTTNPSQMNAHIQTIREQYSQLSEQAQAVVLPIIRELQSLMRR